MVWGCSCLSRLQSWRPSMSTICFIAATGAGAGAMRPMMSEARNSPTDFSSAVRVKPTPPRMAVPAWTATSVNSRKISHCKSWLMLASLDISSERDSRSCSSKLFMSWAALSGPRIMSSAPSFCSLLILAISSAGISICIKVNLIIGFAARQPGADGLGHVGRVLANQLVQHLDRHHSGAGRARFGVMPIAVAVPIAIAVADGNAKRNLIQLGALQHAPKHKNDAEGRCGINELLRQVHPDLMFFLLLKLLGDFSSELIVERHFLEFDFVLAVALARFLNAERALHDVGES